jgi:hypothetical protein
MTSESAAAALLWARLSERERERERARAETERAVLAPALLLLRQYLYFCTRKASAFISRARAPHRFGSPEAQADLYICTSKASKLSTLVLVKQVN